MQNILVTPIVEGDGEIQAVPVLLRRLGAELWGQHFSVMSPIKLPRGKLVKPVELQRAVELASKKLAAKVGDFALRFILILFDADDGCPVQLALEARKSAQEATALDFVCVIANVEYESWFVASAASLAKYLRQRPEDSADSADPEGRRQGKGWVSHRFLGAKYSPTVDQAAMSAFIDIQTTRTNSPSFDKLCRDIGVLITRTATATAAPSETAQ